MWRKRQIKRLEQEDEPYQRDVRQDRADGWSEPRLQRVAGDLRLHPEQELCPRDHGSGGVGQELRVCGQDLYQGRATKGEPN